MRGVDSGEHFMMDGTLNEAWAGQNNFRPRQPRRFKGPDDAGPRSGEYSLGETRSSATRRSTTDPEARLASSGLGKEARLSYLGHVLLEDHNS
jgi:hypothetical protein